MTKKVYNKLVRDKVPEVIRANGEEPVIRILSKEEHLTALLDKLVEEAHELKDDPTLSELADVDEVVLAIRSVMGISPGQLEKARHQKIQERGAFYNRIFLEYTE